MTEEYDKVTQASMNNLYVEAQKLDCGQNAIDAPFAARAGMLGDLETHASTHASDAEPGFSPVPLDDESHVSPHSDGAYFEVRW